MSNPGPGQPPQPHQPPPYSPPPGSPERGFEPAGFVTPGQPNLPTPPAAPAPMHRPGLMANVPPRNRSAVRTTVILLCVTVVMVLITLAFLMAILVRG